MTPSRSRRTAFMSRDFENRSDFAAPVKDRTPDVNAKQSFSEQKQISLRDCCADGCARACHLEKRRQIRLCFLQNRSGTSTRVSPPTVALRVDASCSLRNTA